MDSTEELQNLEITALQSIYAEDFIECPPPKAWKVRGYCLLVLYVCAVGANLDALLREQLGSQNLLYGCLTRTQHMP